MKKLKTEQNKFVWFKAASAIMTTDTVKVCYDAYLYEANTMDVCTRCDTVIFDGTNWVLFSMGNPTNIEELVIERYNDNKMYDLMGRELFYTNSSLLRNV